MNISIQNDNVGIENLPDEVMLKVFSHLNPQELCRSAQVSRRWNSLAMDGSLWMELYPVSWAKGMLLNLVKLRVVKFQSCSVRKLHILIFGSALLCSIWNISSKPRSVVKRKAEF